jgi:hypothetical protein
MQGFGGEILRCIFKKCNVMAWTGTRWLRIGMWGGSCKCGNEPSCSIKRGEFLDYLKTG